MGGAFLMAPWTGRIRRGQLPFLGQTFQIPANWGPDSIHGMAITGSWRVEQATRTAVHCQKRFDVAWPFGGSVEQTIELHHDRLDLTASVVASHGPMPASLGWHPWFSRAGTSEVRLEVDANQVLEMDGDGVPTGRSNPVDRVTDLRGGPLLGSRPLDHVYLAPTSPVRLVLGDFKIAIHFSSPVNSVVVYSTPEAVCVEPATAWPNSCHVPPPYLSSTGWVVLDVGDRVTASCSWRWSRSDGDPPTLAPAQGGDADGQDVVGDVDGRQALV